MPTRVHRLPGVLERFASRRYYPALIAVVAALDYFVPGSPSNAVLAAAVMPRPDRWRVLGVAFAVGCALGAFLLATLLGAFGEPFLAWVLRSEGAGLWLRIEGLVSSYGLLALAALAITPLPVRIAVAVLALTGTAPTVLGGIVLLGRLLVYPAVARLAATAPHLLMRLRPFAARTGMVAPGSADRDPAGAAAAAPDARPSGAGG